MPHRTREALGVKASTRTHRVMETEFSVQEGIWHNVSQYALAGDGLSVARASGNRRLGLINCAHEAAFSPSFRPFWPRGDLTCSQSRRLAMMAI